MTKSQSQTKRFPIQNFAILIVALLVIGAFFGQNAVQVYTGISATGSDTVELTNDGNLDTKVRDFSLESTGGVDGNIFYKVLSLDSTSAVLTDAYARKTVMFESGMQSDFGDLRFVTPGGTNVPYYIIPETVVNGVSADVWLIIPETSATGQSAIHQCYGNDAISSESDRSAFFEYSSDVTTEGQSISGGDYVPSNPPGAKEGAFDDVLVSSQDVNDQWFSETSVESSDTWIGQDFGTASNIVRYRVLVDYPVGSMDANRIPYTWRLDGSDSATFATYTVLDTQTAYTLSDSTWAAFDLNTVGDYRYYRMFVTAVGIGVDNLAFVTEIEMMEFYESETLTWASDSEQYNIGMIDPGISVGDDKLYYDGTLLTTLTYSDGSAYIDSSDVSASMKGSLPIIKVGTTQNIKIDHDLGYSITYLPKNMDVSSPNMFITGEDLAVNTRLTDTNGNPISYQPLEMRIRLFDSEDDRYLDEIVSSTSFVVPGKYLKDGKHYQLRLSYAGFEFGGWSNEILADFTMGTEGFTITSSPDKAPEGIAAASFAAASNLVGMAAAGWLSIPIIGDIIQFIADLLGVTL